MRELPEHWTQTTLGEVAKWGSGGTPSRAISEYFGGSIPWFKTGELNDGVVTHAEEFLTAEGVRNSSAKVFPKGSVLIAMYGATIGRCGILGIDGSTNQACAVAQPYDYVDARYLFFYLKSQRQGFIDKGKGGAQPNISQAVIKEHPFPLAPLAEQKRIVAKLDVLFAHLDQLKARLENIPNLLKQFRQAILTQAVTGKLTGEFKEKESLSWPKSTLKEVCDSITDGDHQAPPKATVGIPFLVISNVNDGKLNLDKVTRYVSSEYYQSLKESRKARLNDILYTVTGSIGIPVFVDVNEPFTFQRHIAIIKPNKRKIDPKFLYTFLKSESAFLQGKSIATGTAQITIPLSGLREYIIPLPSLAKQKEVVSKVETLLTVTDRIEKSYNRVREKIERLPQSILSKAFRGELVLEGYDEDLNSAVLIVTEAESVLSTKKYSTKHSR